MELKLDIYNKKEIEKTYKCDTYDLMFGTVEDFINIVNLDEIKTGSDAEIIKLAGKACLTGMDTIKSFLKDIFDGITDDELKRTKVSDIVSIVVNIVKYSITEISKGAKGKN